MGRKKIEIARIEDQNKRYVTFSKRRAGLFNKAEKFCKLFHGAQVAVIVFSPTAGIPHAFGHDSVDSVIDRFLNDSKNNNKQNVNGIRGERGECSSSSRQNPYPDHPVVIANGVHDNDLQMEKKKRKRNDDDEGCSSWWNAIGDESDMRNYSLEELEMLGARMEELKNNVMIRRGELELQDQQFNTTTTTDNDYQQQQQEEETADLYGFGGGGSGCKNDQLLLTGYGDDSFTIEELLNPCLDTSIDLNWIDY